mmetsp:Transcript_27082/g.54601  ORF Transcript_27082/g.54601 Transcript_27082/m.54601 type:complete len:308 (-) Transcript_27082:178-1101(-)
MLSAGERRGNVARRRRELDWKRSPGGGVAARLEPAGDGNHVQANALPAGVSLLGVLCAADLGDWREADRRRPQQRPVVSRRHHAFVGAQHVPDQRQCGNVVHLQVEQGGKRVSVPGVLRGQAQRVEAVEQSVYAGKRGVAQGVQRRRGGQQHAHRVGERPRRERRAGARELHFLPARRGPRRQRRRHLRRGAQHAHLALQPRPPCRAHLHRLHHPLLLRLLHWLRVPQVPAGDGSGAVCDQARAAKVQGDDGGRRGPGRQITAQKGQEQKGEEGEEDKEEEKEKSEEGQRRQESERHWREKIKENEG